jgi:Flp pilus assembly protein CpaB
MRRRPPRAWLVLVLLSVLLAAATTLVLNGYLARLAARAAEGGPGTRVVVATVALVRGTTLSASALATTDMPEDFVPPGALRSPEEAVGRVLAANVLAGEVITTPRLAPAGGPVASLVPEGLRAVPIAVGLPPATVVAGDLVDVFATFSTGRPYTETVVESAEVLAVRQATGLQGGGENTTLILLVAPDVAERLAHARAFAALAVALTPTPA